MFLTMIRQRLLKFGRKSERHSFIFLLVLICYTNFLFAQNIEEQMSKSRADCQTMLGNAMNVLPKLYREKSFDSLEYAVDMWERSCGSMSEVRITRILLNMETGKFTVSQDVDGAAIEMLDDYAKHFPSPDYMLNYPPKRESQVSFYKFSSVWAKLLLENKKPDENAKFICRVLTGEIKDPGKEIRKNPLIYPEYAVMLEKNFEAKRKLARMNLALSTGVWLPTGNLSTLGVHPSFGFHFGVRNAHHELDLTIQIRYLNSANTYAVKREGRLDSTDYYFGGYIGADYTYYLVSKKRYDIGLLGGMGWDGFDFAPEPYDYYYYDYPYYTSHVTIGSFNANAGLRFNYYFTHSFYVGLQGRYNVIQYSTNGGTNLSGDAVSIDLIFGIN